ncbi:MAG: hypothetical protein LBS39_02530 [Campylobacteraceae bacterium]|jgi:hypothetical protein|nr:hypothetical protein [Campylobacteraceae bacterium]
MLSLQTGDSTLQSTLAKFCYFKNSKTSVSNGFIVSWLISLFVLFGLVGCGGADSSASSGDTTPAKTVVYNLYDDELNFLGNVSSEDANLWAKAYEYGIENWYEADSSEPFDGVYEGNDEVVRLYSVKNVGEVRTEDHLADIASDLSGKYILLNDITLTSDWEPIGTDEENAFTGILNADTSEGKRYSISGLSITKNDIYAGLFGVIKNAIIKNIGVVVDRLAGAMNVGGIAGKSISSNITNSYVLGNITGDGYVGGIVGNASVSKIINSYANVTLSAGDYVGGLAGYVGGSLITNSYAIGSVGGSFNVGGIAGSINSSIVTSSYTGVDVSGNNSVGNIAGTLFAGNLTGSIVIDKGDIGDKIKDVVGNIIDPYLSKISNSNSSLINSILKSLIDDILDSTIDKALDLIKIKDVYSFDLGWKFGKDDANPWVIGNDGKPVLYWQTWQI